MKRPPNRQSCLLLVCPDKKQADLWLEAFRAAGYINASAVDSAETAAARALTTPIEWIVTTLSPRARYTGVNLLQTIATNVSTRHISISFIVTESEQKVLPFVYSMGAYCHFSETPNKPAALQQIHAYGKVVEAARNISVLVPAHYLRCYYRSQKNHSAVLDLEKRLCDMIPNEPRLLLDYAQALYANGDASHARDMLAQAKFLDPNLTARAHYIRESCDQTHPTEHTRHHAVRELHSFATGKDLAVVVEPDLASGRFLSSLLQEIGYKEVAVFDDVLAAWSYIAANRPPDLIVHEWKLRGLGGAAFVQRVRSHGLLDTAIVVTSALIDAADRPLLRELSVASVIPKPINKENFTVAMRWLRSQQRRPTAQMTLESKIESHLRKSEHGLAQQLKAVYLADPSISDARKLIMRARFFYHQGNYQAAKDELVASTSLAAEEPLEAINLLGKCFYQLKQPRLALQCFQKTQKFSPRNILRLCQIADAHIELGQLREAKQILRTAEQIDGENGHIIVTSTKLAFTEQHLEAASELMQKIPCIDPIISYMNNKAVATVVAGEVDTGIRMYKFALRLIPAKRRDLMSVLHYNLGLGFVRSGKLNLAEYALRDALEASSEKIERKAQSLLSRVARTNSTGAELILYRGDREAEDSNAFDLEFERIGGEDILGETPAFDLAPGEYGLWGVIPAPEPDSKLLKQLIGKLVDGIHRAA